MPWHTVTYKRDTLYDQVWTESICTVATRYGVSDVGLAKICKKPGGPTSGRGWL